MKKIIIKILIIKIFIQLIRTKNIIIHKILSLNLKIIYKCKYNLMAVK